MKIRNLCCHRDVDIAIKCLGSLSSYLEGDCQLVIHDDGSLTEVDIANLQRAIPNSVVIRRTEADVTLDHVLRSRYPHLRRARTRLPYFLNLLTSS